MRFLERFRREPDVVWEPRTRFLVTPRGGTQSDRELLIRFRDEMLKNPYFELRNPNGALVLYYGAVRMDSIRLPFAAEDDKQKRENQEKLEKILKEIPVKNVPIARMIIGVKIPDVVTFKFPRPIIDFLQSLWTDSHI